MREQRVDGHTHRRRHQNKGKRVCARSHDSKVWVRQEIKTPKIPIKKDLRKNETIGVAFFYWLG